MASLACSLFTCYLLQSVASHSESTGGGGGGGGVRGDLASHSESTGYRWSVSPSVGGPVLLCSPFMDFTSGCMDKASHPDVIKLLQLVSIINGKLPAVSLSNAHSYN